jgi:GNAT superfamily N-acetyltransferase
MRARVTLAEIRRATESDARELIPLVEEYWRFENISGFDPGGVEGQLRRLLSEPKLGVGWIATVEGVAVGYLLAVYVFSLEHWGLTAEIDEFFVRPARRGQGAGAALLRAAEAEFRRAGCTNVAFQLSRSNDSARAFYRRHGYRERSGYELLDKMLDGR